MNLGDRMKSYESKERIPYDEHLVIRLDGCKFSKFTKSFKKPFDEIFSKAMEKTSKDLLERFNASSVYTQSDEITMILPYSYKVKNTTIFPTKENIDGCIASKFGVRYKVLFVQDNKFDKYKCVVTDKYLTIFESEDGEDLETILNDYVIRKEKIINEQVFGGKIQKIVSLTSSYCTVRFNHHIRKLAQEFREIIIERNDTNIDDLKYIDKIYKKFDTAYFDSRCYGLKDEAEVFNSILFRYRDGVRNSKQSFAYTYCGHKKLLNKTANEQIEFCKSETGKDWNDIPDRYKYGILLKREEYFKDVELCLLPVKRTKITSLSKELKISDENVDLILRKYL